VTHGELPVGVAIQAGGKAELMRLPDVGISGNSHMMPDRNNLVVADWLRRWIDKHVQHTSQAR
jgi:hypothetical protein